MSGDLGFAQMPVWEFSQTRNRPRRARAWNPFIFPPLMSRTASTAEWGPPALRFAVSWYGLTHTCVFGSGEQTVGTPFCIGIPSAPG